MFNLQKPIAPTVSPIDAVEVSGQFTPGGPPLTPGGAARPASVRIRAQFYSAGKPVPTPAALQALAMTSAAESAAFLATVAEPGETLAHLLDRATEAYLASKGVQ